MTAPSNANASGLAVVAWRYRTAPHRDWHETECSEVARVEEMDGSEVEPLHVTAASAQARIAELEADIRFRNERWNAAEARADRLAKVLRRIAQYREEPGGPPPDDEMQSIARTALQQETQP